MKKIIVLTLIAVSAGVSGFAEVEDCSLEAKSWEVAEQDLKVVNVCDFTDEELQGLKEGNFPKLAVEFSENTMLPIDFFFSGDLLSLVGEKESFGLIEVKQTFYLRLVDGELILSSDLSDWKPLFEFVTGNVSIAAEIREGEPSIAFRLKANRRID